MMIIDAILELAESITVTTRPKAQPTFELKRLNDGTWSVEVACNRIHANHTGPSADDVLQKLYDELVSINEQQELKISARLKRWGRSALTTMRLVKDDEPKRKDN